MFSIKIKDINGKARTPFFPVGIKGIYAPSIFVRTPFTAIYKGPLRYLMAHSYNIP